MNTDKSRFVLLLGPSAVGKSAVIEELERQDRRFEYVRPLTTRPLRDGETNKVHVSSEQMDAMDRLGSLLARNTIFGHEYGTPRIPIDSALQQGRFPCLDWPISRLNVMSASYRERIFCVYLLPPSLGTLRKRLQKDGRDPTGERWVQACAEIKAALQGQFSAVDLFLISRDGQIPLMAQQILSCVSNSLSRSTGLNECSVEGKAYR